jgi:hypothetical protein
MDTLGSLEPESFGVPLESFVLEMSMIWVSIIRKTRVACQGGRLVGALVPLISIQTGYSQNTVSLSLCAMLHFATPLHKP